jgi:eukaryotic-like serine/threonine-protein kinase
VKICPTCGVEYGDDQKFCPSDGSALRSTQQGDLVGGVVAERYHILKKLGEGGMGAVYLGEHVKMGRKSAIKVMSAQMANDAEAIARFNREAANASRINHPNVCAIYDFGETPDGLIYLAMEFIEGGSLGNVLDHEGALPATRAAAILSQTADALQAAHDLGIVHRDLKPDNIMLARGRDGADVVKVVDFGIAKAMTGEEGQKVTKTGLVVGTPEYMSPEQLSGDVLDGRSDIYSLALVYYRMVTGTLPFDADNAQEMMIKRLTDEPRSLGTVRPELGAPPALETAVRRALARMPGERYTSAVEFARDVRRATEGMADAPAGSIADAATQVIGAQSGESTTQLAPTRAGPAQRPPTTTPVTPTTPQPRPSTATPPKKRTPVLVIATAALLLVGGGATAMVMLKGHSATDNGNNTQLAAADTQATALDTASHRGDGPTHTGGNGRTNPTNPRTTPSDGGGPKPEAPPPVDSARIASELGSLLDRVPAGEATDPGVLDSLNLIFNDTRNPVTLRADAAAYAAQSYWGVNDTVRACQRVRSALGLVPSKASYQRFLTMYGCGG